MNQTGPEHHQGCDALESAVAKVVRRWALDERVAGSNLGRVTVFAFLGKMLAVDCLSPHRCMSTRFGHVLTPKCWCAARVNVHNHRTGKL